MGDPAIAGPHLVRYGTVADQKYLLGQFLNTYDHLVIKARMMAFAPAALTSFLTQRAKNKPYFLDPDTHVFQHDVSNLLSTSKKDPGRLRPSIAKLVRAYGAPVQERVGDDRQSILPDDFEDDKQRAGFCERVLRFQANAVASEAESSADAKYYQFLVDLGKAGTQYPRPSMVVAPYFYMTASTLEKWLPVNVDCANDSHPIAKKLGIPLGLEIVISREVLTDPMLRSLVVDTYAEAPAPDVYLIWIDGFDEHQASKSELDAYVTLVRALGARAGVVSLYGGFLSVELIRSGLLNELRGVTHGLEYGEDRQVLPVSGGVPAAKFYMPATHERLDFRDALRVARTLGGLASVSEYKKRVCDCKECADVVTGDPEREFALYGESRVISYLVNGIPTVREFPLPETKARCVRHYMWSKEREYRGKQAVKDTIAGLRKAAEDLKRELGLGAVVHCNIWADVLEGGSSAKGARGRQ